MNHMKFCAVGESVDAVLSGVVEVELNGVELFCGAILEVLDGDGGEGERVHQVFVVWIVGLLGVELIFGGESEGLDLVTSLHIFGDDVDGRLVLSGLAVAAPALLFLIILAKGEA